MKKTNKTKQNKTKTKQIKTKQKQKHNTIQKAKRMSTTDHTKTRDEPMSS